MRGGFVDAFFAISGFLIVASWVRQPDWRRFLRARFLRIMPGFWICLMIVAFGLAPVHALIYGHHLDWRFVGQEWGYVWKNAALWIFQPGIDGTPLGAARQETGSWNGSLWTLSWEFLCYLGVLALGLARLLSRRRLVLALFIAAATALALTGTPLLTGYLAHHAARFATMFLAGAVLYLYRDRVPASGWLIAASLVLVTLSTALPDYRVLGALPLAYAVVVGASMASHPRLVLRTDLSYGTYIYGYPVQQMLVLLLGMGVGVPLLSLISVVAVLPFAAASWFVVEKRALRLKSVSWSPLPGITRLRAARSSG
jgi:peptidoglycan/LPS O-acetylase OafA/YrhL